MKKIVIVGAGGFGREVKMLIDQINSFKLTYEILGFYDDAQDIPAYINGLPYLGNVLKLAERNDSVSVALGLGDPKSKAFVVSQLENSDLNFPTLIHPSVLIGGDNAEFGKGCVICAKTIITCNVEIRDFVTLNLACTVGHDTVLNEFSSFMPSVNISGEVLIEKNVYIGTGAKIINGLKIGENTIIGAGAVVSKSLPSNCTAVGVPAKIIT